MNAKPVQNEPASGWEARRHNRRLVAALCGLAGVYLVGRSLGIMRDELDQAEEDLAGWKGTAETYQTQAHMLERANRELRAGRLVYRDGPVPTRRVEHEEHPRLQPGDRCPVPACSYQRPQAEG